MSTLIAIVVAVIGTGMVAYSVREIRSKGAAAAMQMAAFGFLLIGASAAGLVKFMTSLVLNPLAWIGIGLLSLAGVLFVVGQKLEGPSGTSKKARQVEEGPGKKPAVDQSPKQKAKGKAEVDEDFDDIQAILRKHGIE